MRTAPIQRVVQAPCIAASSRSSFRNDLAAPALAHESRGCAFPTPQMRQTWQVVDWGNRFFAASSYADGKRSRKTKHAESGFLNLVMKAEEIDPLSFTWYGRILRRRLSSTLMSSTAIPSINRNTGEAPVQNTPTIHGLPRTREARAYQDSG